MDLIVRFEVVKLADHLKDQVDGKVIINISSRAVGGSEDRAERAYACPTM